MSAREIKFRAWDKVQNKLFHFDRQWFDSEYSSLAFHIVEEEDIGGYSLPFDSDEIEAVMQYTGLKDRNGVEIYEGDIVEIEGERLEVRYEAPSFDCHPLHVSGENQLAWATGHMKGNLAEVVGNIHESPESLTRPE
jgi:uncharacterized phage protein (TIGR01671 family)